MARSTLESTHLKRLEKIKPSRGDEKDQKSDWYKGTTGMYECLELKRAQSMK